MQGMIHHHAQALLMTSLVRERSASPDIPLLARRTEISQETEIETMEKWLIARDEKPPDEEDHRTGHGPGAGLMPGMVSAGKLARLAAAEGREFDRLFLEYMTRHHLGALTMVRGLAAANGGAEPEIGLFTRHVEADQDIEIDRMQDLLAELEGEPNRSAPAPGPGLAGGERAADSRGPCRWQAADLLRRLDGSNPSAGACVGPDKASESGGEQDEESIRAAAGACWPWAPSSSSRPRRKAGARQARTCSSSTS